MTESSFIKSTAAAGDVYIFKSAQSEEHRRLEIQHSALEQLMFGKLVHAPAPKHIRKILDIGCGTGATTTRLAKDFPDAKIVGLDQASVPPIHPKPENVEYIQGRFDELASQGHEALQPGRFDLIFARALVLGVQDWQRHLAYCFELLAPCGYLECHEPSVFVHYSAASPNTPIDQDWKWPHRVHARALKNFSIDLRVGEKLSTLLPAAGLEAVETEIYPFVLYPWPEKPETQAQGEYFWEYAPQINRGAIEYYCQGDFGPEEIKEMQLESDQTAFKGDIVGMHNRVYVTFGHKVQN